MNRSVRNSVSVLLLSGASLAAFAQTATTTFTVSATIVGACAVTATNLAFGNYNPASATALDGTSAVAVSCTSGTTFTTALNIGTGGGSFATRTMISGVDTLDYNLFTSAARTTIWGDGTAGTSTVPGTGTGLLTPVNLTVHGRIPAGQDRPTGVYTSLITVTVTF